MTCHDLYPESVTSSAPPARRRIVVGVDGSPGSLASLRWAAEQAVEFGAEIEAVYVISPIIAMDYTGAGFAALPQTDLDAVRADADDRLCEWVRAGAGAIAPQVRRLVVEDASPGHALVRRAGAASTLVVGAHHHHGLGFLLGSTSGSCVRHASCPVVVVPERWPTEDSARQRPDAGHSRPLVTTGGAP